MAKEELTNEEEILKDLATEIFSRLEIDGGIEVGRDPEDLDLFRVDLHTEEAGLLIGHHGETLSSLQIILGLALYRQVGTWKQVLVDVDGYRDEQKTRLEEMARRTADRARFFARPVYLEPMSAYERRVIHVALAEDPDVETESVGEGRDRRVSVRPAGYSEQEQKTTADPAGQSPTAATD